MSAEQWKRQQHLVKFGNGHNSCIHCAWTEEEVEAYAALAYRDEPKPPSQPVSAMSAEQFYMYKWRDQNANKPIDLSLMFDFAEAYAARELSIVRAECEALKQRYAKLVKALSVAECLPGCDAYGHEEKCPNASVAERLVAAEAERDRLQQWKESAIKVMPDYQEIGRLLAIQWGESVHDKIVPGIVALQAERDRLKQELDALKAERG